MRATDVLNSSGLNCAVTHLDPHQIEEEKGLTRIRPIASYMQGLSLKAVFTSGLFLHLRHAIFGRQEQESAWMDGARGLCFCSVNEIVHARSLDRQPTEG